MMQHDGVGDLEDQGEFGLGVAPRHLKPVNKIELSKKKEEEMALMQADDDEGTSGGGQGGADGDEEADSKLEIMRLKKQREKKRKPIDRQSAFLEFKSAGEGKAIEDQVLSNRNELKDKKVRVKELSEKCNTFKREMDQIKAKLDEKAEEKKLQMKEDLAGLDDDDFTGGNDNAD